MQKINNGIKDIFKKENFTEYLSVMAKFHNYSVNNTILIYMNNPKATMLADFNKWRDTFGRQVSRNQKSIRVISSAEYKAKDKSEDAVAVKKYKPMTVFDISQTYGAPVKNITVKLDENWSNFEYIKDAINQSFQGLNFTDNKEDPDKARVIADMIKSAVEANFNFNEFENVSIVYAVCSALGVDADKTALDDISDFAEGKKTSDLKACLENIKITASEYIKAISTRYHEIERQATITPAEKLTDKIMDIIADNNTYSKSDILNMCKTGNLKAVEATLSGVADSEKANMLKAEISEYINGFTDAVYNLNNEYIIDSHFKDDGDIDYSIYDGNSFKHIDGGVIENDGIRTLFECISEIAWDKGFDIKDITDMSPLVRERLEAVNAMLDNTLTVNDMQEYGYKDLTMIPLSKERAKELCEAGCTIYMLHDDNTETEVTEIEDISMHSGLFGIDRNESERMKSVIDRLDKSKDFELSFINNAENAYAIYQLKDNDQTIELSLKKFDELSEKHIPVDKTNYECVYSGINNENLDLNDLYEKFNIGGYPKEYMGHLLSVSDIVAVKNDDVITYHYVDSVGFRELPDFNLQEHKTTDLKTDRFSELIHKNENEAIKPKEHDKLKSIDEKISEKSAIVKANPIQRTERGNNQMSI